MFCSHDERESFSQLGRMMSGTPNMLGETCPAVAEMLERCLCLLFATRDVPQVGCTALSRV